jgi:hypothetical protein
VTLAPAATEARPDHERWIGFDDPYRSQAGWSRWPLKICWNENVIYRGDDEGTLAVRNTWIPQATYLFGVVREQLEQTYGAPDIYWIDDDITRVKVVSPRAVTVVATMLVSDEPHAGDASMTETASEPVEVGLPESAAVAREVRELSGLSAAKLGDVFPVQREIFQRWIAGSPPSAANLERLLALRHFLRALAARVQDPKTWLLSPLKEDAASPTAYDLLKAGNLAAVWDAIVALPSKRKRYTREISGEGAVTVAEGSLRGRDYRTSEEELDDYAELFDEE